MTKELFDRLADVPNKMRRPVEAFATPFDLLHVLFDASYELNIIIYKLNTKGGLDKISLARLTDSAEALNRALHRINSTISAFYDARTLVGELTALVNDIKAKEDLACK